MTTREKIIIAANTLFIEEGFADNIHSELKDSNMTIIQKFDRVFEILISSKLDNTAFRTQLSDSFETYYSISNYVYLETMEKISLLYFTPIFSNILKEGMLFDEQYDVDEISRMILRVSFIFSKESVSILTSIQAKDKDYIKSKLISYANSYRMMIERLLGLPENSLKKIDTSNFLT